MTPTSKMLALPNKASDQTDFFTIGQIDHDASGAGHHIVVQAVPEPLTILGSATAVGFGAFFKCKTGKKRHKQDKS
jgi:hypothetical protein